MSLYTLAANHASPPAKAVRELRIEESSNVALLSVMGSTSEEEVVRRLANDHVAFVAYLNNTPAAFGWMARGKAFIGELNHTVILPPGHRYLWNFRTLETFRGLGIYPTLLQRIIELEDNQAVRFWIIHAPENEASLRGIQKAGFQFVGKLYNTGENTVIEATAGAFENREHLREMAIAISNDKPVSCWNCSSPYLKKRKSECCCASLGKICVGYNLPEMTNTTAYSS